MLSYISTYMNIRVKIGALLWLVIYALNLQGYQGQGYIRVGGSRICTWVRGRLGLVIFARIQISGLGLVIHICTYVNIRVKIRVSHICTYMNIRVKIRVSHICTYMNIRFRVRLGLSYITALGLGLVVHALIWISGLVILALTI